MIVMEILGFGRGLLQRPQSSCWRKSEGDIERGMLPTSKLKASRDLFACTSSLRGDIGATKCHFGGGRVAKERGRL
jgi:hypothetical protein